MRKIFKSFTFWSFVASILIISINLKGYDDNLLLIALNPILNYAVYTEPFRSITWNNGPNFYMYIAHLFTFIIPAGIIDIIIYIIKNGINKAKSFNNNEQS